MRHELKTPPTFFNDIIEGNKNFEVRYNDRGYAIGDVVVLQEWCSGAGYSYREVEREIVFILQGGQYGVEIGWVVLGLRPKLEVKHD